MEQDFNDDDGKLISSLAHESLLGVSWLSNTNGEENEVIVNCLFDSSLYTLKKNDPFISF